MSLVIWTFKKQYNVYLLEKMFTYLNYKLSGLLLN